MDHHRLKHKVVTNTRSKSFIAYSALQEQNRVSFFNNFKTELYFQHFDDAIYRT